MTYELVIVGGGPAAAAAGVYAASLHIHSAPTNPAVRVLRHGKTPVFPAPFPRHKLE